MNNLIRNIIRFARTLSVLIALPAILFLSSNQGLVEESFHESVSHEIELVIARRDPARADKSQFAAQTSYPESKRFRFGRSSSFPSFLASSERAQMNGTGTYLLI